jgi:hypothetical protein
MTARAAFFRRVDTSLSLRLCLTRKSRPRWLEWSGTPGLFELAQEAFNSRSLIFKGSLLRGSEGFSDVAADVSRKR